MASSNPVLPQGAGYGVGKYYFVRSCDRRFTTPRSDWDRLVLQRLHGWPDGHSITIHWLLSQEFGGVQQRFKERQTWLDRIWHRICLDMGCYTGSSESLYLVPPV